MALVQFWPLVASLPLTERWLLTIHHLRALLQGSFQMIVENNYSIAITPLSGWLMNPALVFQQNQNKSHLVRVIFPALWASYRKLLGILISSSRCLLLLWLVGVIDMLFFFSAVIWKSLCSTMVNNYYDSTVDSSRRWSITRVQWDTVISHNVHFEILIAKTQNV